MSTYDKRYPANFPVLVRKGPDIISATFCNISLNGGCILGATTLRKGDRVVLDYGAGQTRATAIWALGRMTGLLFENPLSDCGLDTIRVRTAAA